MATRTLHIGCSAGVPRATRTGHSLLASKPCTLVGKKPHHRNVVWRRNSVTASQSLSSNDVAQAEATVLKTLAGERLTRTLI
eukprot:1184799-Prorocentrum_minimum.AAC.4